MPMIKLNKITADHGADFHTDNEEGEGAQGLVTTPVSVNVAAIRCFYARKNDRPGTRITFTDGGGFAVAELYAEVADKVGGLV